MPQNLNVGSKRHKKVRLTLERAVRRGTWTLRTSRLLDLVDFGHEHDATVVERIPSISLESVDIHCEQKNK